jgi:hypothetical protein
MGNAEETRSLSRSLFTSRVGRGDFGLGGRLAILLKVREHKRENISSLLPNGIYMPPMHLLGLQLSDCTSDGLSTCPIKVFFENSLPIG